MKKLRKLGIITKRRVPKEAPRFAQARKIYLLEHSGEQLLYFLVNDLNNIFERCKESVTEQLYDEGYEVIE